MRESMEGVFVAICYRKKNADGSVRRTLLGSEFHRACQGTKP